MRARLNHTTIKHILYSFYHTTKKKEDEEGF